MILISFRDVWRYRWFNRYIMYNCGSRFSNQPHGPLDSRAAWPLTYTCAFQQWGSILRSYRRNISIVYLFHKFDNICPNHYFRVDAYNSGNNLRYTCIECSLHRTCLVTVGRKLKAIHNRSSHKTLDRGKHTALKRQAWRLYICLCRTFSLPNFLRCCTGRQI